MENCGEAPAQAAPFPSSPPQAVEYVVDKEIHGLGGGGGVCRADIVFAVKELNRSLNGPTEEDFKRLKTPPGVHEGITALQDDIEAFHHDRGGVRPRG